jgi:hypothetical protein
VVGGMTALPMPSRPQPGRSLLPRARGAARRRSLALMLVVVVASTFALVLANVLGHEYRWRPDVTRTGEQSLAQSTLRALARLEGPCRIVIAVDFRTVDPRSRRAVQDVLDAMRRENDRLMVDFIDTGSSQGLSVYRQVIVGLVERERDVLSAQRDAVELANSACVALAIYLNDSLSPALLDLQQRLPASGAAPQMTQRVLEQFAAQARVDSRALHDAASASGEFLKARLGDIPLPATDKGAEAVIDALSPSIDHLDALVQELTRVGSAPWAAGPGADEARNLVPAIQQRRDQAAVLLESLRRLKRPDLLRVARILEGAQAALVIGPPGTGLAAVELEDLFPPGTPLDHPSASNTDMRRRAEELLTAAIASLFNTRRPIVMLVTGEHAPVLNQEGLFTRLRERLRLRGIDVVEWPVAVSEEPPSLLDIDPEARNPDRRRPVVPVFLSPDSSAAPPRGGLSGSQRAFRIGETLSKALQDGQNTLVCLNPSILPGQGDRDPISGALAPLGLSADTGRPLLRELVTPRGRLIDTAVLVHPVETPPGQTAPINGAIRGLPLALTWPVVIVERPVGDRARISLTPLCVLPAGDSVWCESEWLRLWQTPPEARTLIRQDDLPKFDENRDARWPTGNPSQKDQRWLLAAAVQRSELGRKPQRAVVVGSNSWFVDAVAFATVSVDGRPTLRNPGNLELLEASIFWLAEQDSLIAQSPTALASPMVGPISEKALTRLRLMLILGLPLCVLVCGLVYRLVRA